MVEMNNYNVRKGKSVLATDDMIGFHLPFYLRVWLSKNGDF